jgi:3-oxoacyl-[acyl-carrier protein] reductase
MAKMLENKIALVTGASRGIGKQIALTLADEGAYVIVNYNGSKEAADAVVDTIVANGGNAESVQCAVGDFAAVEEMIKTLYKKLGHIDILVNNAGITRDDLLMKMKEEDFDAVIETNLKGSFNTMRHIARYMLKQKGGSIINISSVSGILGNPGQMNYCASKAGVIGMTKSMARELASRGIRVNAVAPGFVATEMTDKISDAAREAGLAQIPFGRFGQPQDIANAVAFLASEKASYITGQVICVDGGMAM